MRAQRSYDDLVKEAKHLGEQVRAAAKCENPRHLIRAQDRFLNSPACKFLAAHRVRLHRSRSAGYGTPSNETQAAKAQEIACQLNANLARDEQVCIEAVCRMQE